MALKMNVKIEGGQFNVANAYIVPTISGNKRDGFTYSTQAYKDKAAKDAKKAPLGVSLPGGKVAYSTDILAAVYADAKKLPAFKTAKDC